MFIACKNYQEGNINCELCIANKSYIAVQNIKCQSCFKSVLEIK